LAAASDTVTPIIRLTDVSKRFGNRWVLARLSFDIEPGSAVLLTGDNGAGKTTLLKIISTLLKPTFGRVELFGAPIKGTSPDARARLGLMTHSTHLYDAQSGRENLRFAARMAGVSAAAEIDGVLDRVGLATHADRPVRGYSAGMKRRLMMARLLLKQPELVLLDEPWGQLDAGAIELMDDMIRNLRAAGATVVVATHDIERALPLCSVRVRLAHGRRVD
jgi:heme exporter protein A